MRIGVIGKGNVGSALGPRWSRLGHQVSFGVRDPEDPAAQVVVGQCEGQADLLTVPEVFEVCDPVLLAVRWEDVPAVLTQARDLRGKTLIDCTTPLEPGTKEPLLDWTLSGAERIAKWAEGAIVIKCFDTTGARVMLDPRFGDTAATMFLCGDEPEAKKMVWSLAEQLGFECEDAGSLQAARYLEALSAFWVHLSFGQGFGSEFAFKLLRRKGDGV